MGYVRRIVLPIVIFLMVSALSFSEKSLLTEEEMGDFVAEEGVCDIRLPDTCNTDPETKETMAIVKKNKTFVAEDPTSGQIQNIDISYQLKAVNDQLGGPPDMTLNPSPFHYKH